MEPDQAPSPATVERRKTEPLTRRGLGRNRVALLDAFFTSRMGNHKCQPVLAFAVQGRPIFRREPPTAQHLAFEVSNQI